MTICDLTKVLICFWVDNTYEVQIIPAVQNVNSDREVTLALLVTLVLIFKVNQLPLSWVSI